MTARLDLTAAAVVWQREHQARVESVLERLLPPADRVPTRLHRAMRYAVLGGGKRIRPLLVYAALESTDSTAEAGDHVAAAVEFVHCYSLIHDDLPCMDDGVLRRGRPALHLEFDQATALLAGDSLQSLAFYVLGQVDPGAGRLVHGLAAACGSSGMAGGQAIDLASVGVELCLADLQHMHQLKTGALIGASVKLGGLCGSPVQPWHHIALDQYAGCVGLAFQIVDDILDAESTTEALGKTAGKDGADNKPNYVRLLGLGGAKARAAELCEQALEALAPLGERAQRLRELADLIIRRNS